MNVRTVSLLLAVTVLPPTAAIGLDAEGGIKMKAGTLSEARRDLGTGTAEDIRASYLDLQPQLLTHFSDTFSNFIRLQAFAPSHFVVTNDQDEPQEMESYAAVREFWIEYGGITDYPGEALRLGLQRLRDPDGLWFDRDIESARWIFDTTLYQFQIGGAKAFNTYRTDDIELPKSQKDRAYVFSDFGGQWAPNQFMTLRLAYATDQKPLPENGAQMMPTGTTTDPTTGATVTTYESPEQRRYGWVSGAFDNRFYEWQREAGISYRLEAVGLVGKRDYVVTDPGTGAVTGTAEQDVQAFGGEAGLRARFADAFPLTVGSAIAYGQGGSSNGTSHVFRQTGLQSNRSRFTGTRTMMNRFNEALQADLQNLRDMTAFISLPLPDWDFSAAVHRFQRNDPDSPVSTDGIDVKPDPASRSLDLGRGWDFVLTRHFGGVASQGYSNGDDTRSNIRFRASQFMPGKAYAPDVDNQTWLMLEGTLWF